MIRIKEGYCRLEHRYLFQEVARRVAAFHAASPETDIIRMGIGDVTLPIAPAVIRAMHEAVDDLSVQEKFHGYGPEHGYGWLRDAVVRGDYASRGIAVDPEEIFINDGAKSDLGNILDLFSDDNTVGIIDPVYPVYVDTNVIDGRRIRYIPCSEENGFTGKIPEEKLDIVYLCYPNNPTGAVISRAKLGEWVDYALRSGALILYDSAYEAFIQDPDIPHSIYEIDGARNCAIEFRSFSKTAGFTGIRCGYTVVPKELRGRSAEAAEKSLNGLWERRQGCKFNGASYVSQRGAYAVYTPEGREQTRESILYYLGNAAIIREGLQRAGLHASGGENAPYVWARTPDGMDDWEFFDILLKRAGIVITPGSGFGRAGQGYFRLTSFANRERTIQAMERLEHCINGL
jgi:LL-diaminopimelate aminotransferase